MKHLLLGIGCLTPDQSIQQTHDKVVDALKKIGPEWGISYDADVPAPKYVRPNQYNSAVNFTPFMAKGITALFSYGNPECKRGLIVNGFDIRFTPRNVHFPMMFDYIRQYIECLNLNQLELRKWESFQYRESIGSSETIGWIFPVHFFNDEVAQKTFDLDAKEVCERLKKEGVAETIENFRDGVLIIRTRKETTFEEDREFDLQVHEILSR